MAKSVLTGICDFLHTTQNGMTVGTGTPKPVWGNILVFDQTNTLTPHIVSNSGVYRQKSEASSLRLFWPFKRMFDVLLSLLLLPILIIVVFVLLVLNPFLNQGPLFYFQTRMGKDCRAFRLMKFRTMHCSSKVSRSANDPLEKHRITPLGHFLRKTRIDELPQILNVIIGDMSLIGPRPDYFHHARRFVRTIPGYRERHTVRPGISGLAQIQLGYIEGHDATVRKVHSDLRYIETTNLKLDLWIFWNTLLTIVFRRGC